MKTRQQRLAEERAGHPPSPPQSLPMNQPGPRRARSKTPSATVAAGSVVSAAQSAALGGPQALLRVWVDVGPELSSRPINEPTHQVAFDSSLLPKVVDYLNNIRNPSNENPTLHQDILEREVGEAIEPREPEPVTAGKSTKRRKNAFRRNPLMALSGQSQPVPASVDSAAADDIPMIFRSDFNFAANSPSDETSQQPDEKLSAHENSHMVDVSVSGSRIGPSAEISQQANAQHGPLAPHTPRGNKWGLGGLLESARSITRCLGFSSLAPVSESPEASPQTASTRAPLTVTESAAPAQPKKKSSAPTSASYRRTKSRRHDDLAVKPGSTSRRNERAWAKRAIGAEDEGFPAMKSTHPENHEEEARQAVVGDPIATIRWPSRSLDRMNANKRKRFGDPPDTPGTEARGHGRGATDIYGGSEEGSTEEQPMKRRRTEQSGGVAGNSGVARPSAVGWQGGNIFAEDQATRGVASTGPQSLPKTPIPITNRTGTFKVPSPGDGDWSDSSSDEDEGDNASLEGIALSRTNNGGFVVGGPSKPLQTLRPSESEALRKAREKSQKYRPRKPSRLSHSIKAYPSPPRASERQSDPSGRTKFTAFEDWCKTAPPAAIAAIEQMDVDSNMAGNAVEAALLENPGPGRACQHTAYEEWCRTAPPTVTAALEHMEVDSNIAGRAFMSGLDKFIEEK